MKFSYAEKKKTKQKHHRLYRSPRQGDMEWVSKIRQFFWVYSKFPIKLNSNIQVQTALKEVTQTPEVSFFCPRFIHCLLT